MILTSGRWMLELTKWDGPRLAYVPEASDVGAIFDQVTFTWEMSLEVSDLWQAVDRLGWPVRSRRLAEAGTTIRSLLIPRLAGGFSIVVNSDREPSEDRITWLIAHEFAHSLFYTDQAPPRRIIPPSQQEEDFCDAFADLACHRAALQGNLSLL